MAKKKIDFPDMMPESAFETSERGKNGWAAIAIYKGYIYNTTEGQQLPGWVKFTGWVKNRKATDEEEILARAVSFHKNRIGKVFNIVDGDVNRPIEV